MTPNNAIFRKIFEICDHYGNATDYRMDSKLSYPFIYVGNVNAEDESNSDLVGTSNVSLDVYGLRTDRNILDSIQSSLHNEFIGLDEAFGYHLHVERIQQDVRADNTDVQPLLRVMIRLTIKYTKKER